jgi:hypothetical protein
VSAQPSKIASTNGRRPQPTRWTRKRIGFAIGVLFAAGLVAAALDLRFVIGGAPRHVEPNSLLVLDARTMESLRNVPHSRGPVPPAVVRGAGLVWTTDADRNRLIGTNPVSKRVVRDVVVGTTPVDAAVGFDAVWVANSGNGSITWVPLDGKTPEAIGLADQPSTITTGAGYVWVTSGPGSKVIRIDPKTKQVTKIVRLANPPLALTAGQGRAYVTIGD